MSSDTDDVTKVIVTENNWIILETNAINGVNRVRDFHDIGARGVQQIEYVVDCVARKLALIEFVVVPTVDAESHLFKNRKASNSSFYSPVVQHDKNIVETACHLHHSGR